jgi:signal peptidase I
MITSPSRGLRWWMREAVFTLAAAAGVICLLATLAAVAFDLRPLVFRSGSMGPDIRTGALGVAHSVAASAVRPGEVVSVMTSQGTRVTHRVVSTSPAGDLVRLELKGDANAISDAETYVVSRVDRLVFFVNGAGYVVGWLSGPIGIFAGGLLVGALLMYAFDVRRQQPPARHDRKNPHPVPSAHREEPPQARSRRATTRGLRRAGGALLVPVVAVSWASAGTRAAWADSGTATTGTFHSYAVSAPVLDCGQLSLGSAAVDWSHVPDATSYAVTVTRSGQAPQTTIVATSPRRYTVTGLTGAATTVTVAAQVDYGSTTWVSGPSNVRTLTFVAIVAVCN